MPESELKVRAATVGDVCRVVECVQSLRRELSGMPDLTTGGAASVCERLIGGRAPGAVFVAESTDGAVIGVLTLSVQEAVRVGGAYAEIQELWVEPGSRANGAGAALIEAAASECRARGIEIIEVGLPNQGFAELPRTESFYRRSGFEDWGGRMRKRIGDSL